MDVLTLTMAAPNASVELPAKAATMLLHNRLSKVFAFAPQIYATHNKPLAKTKTGRLPI